VKPDGGIAMTAFPNPASDIVTLNARFDATATVTVRMLNMLGQDVLPVIRELAARGMYTKQLDVSALPTGVYVLDVSTDAHRTVTQLVKYE
jgi:Secretion system C-terminal sorting domain